MNGINSVQVTLARVLNVAITDDTLSVDLEDGRTVSVPIGWYPRLAYGTDSERSNFEKRQVIVLSASVCEPSTLRAVSTNQDQRDASRILTPPTLRRQQTTAAHQVRWPS